MSKSSGTQRSLLINPPVYDLRLDWARWHQPCGLLRIASALKNAGHEVQLLDCLQPVGRMRLGMKKAGTISIEGQDLQRWQFGWSWEQIERKAEGLQQEKWIPDNIYVTCPMTFWWESARDLVTRLSEWFPKSRIKLGGVYPSLCADHAKSHFPEVEFDLALSKLAKRHQTDLSLYERHARFAAIFLCRSPSANVIVKEIEGKIRLGINEIVFFDDEIPGKDPDHFEAVLDLIIKRDLGVKLRALGNLSPKGLTRSLVLKMKRAGYRQIFLRDDLALGANVNGDLKAYERGIEILMKHGRFRPRTEDLNAMVLVGVPNENLERTVERVTRLAHYVGSVSLVPFQPSPGTFIYESYSEYLQGIPLELQNGKLFPFRTLNHISFFEYQELTRLAALLNSKYRDTTFDFLGDNEIAKMVQKSVAEERWKPKMRETIPLTPVGRD